jgi:apolipoprotein N-acyltransferase
MKKLWKTPFRSMVFSAVLFGILSTLSLEPFNYPLTVYPCLWILFYQTQRLSQSPLKLMWFGFMSAFFLCVFGFYWTIHLFTVFGGLPLYLAVFTFIPYTFLLNLKIIFLVLALALVNQARIRRLRLPSLIVVPTLAVGLDLIFPQVFNWYWGNLLAGNPYFAQLAEYVGIHGLSFLLFFIGLWFVQTSMRTLLSTLVLE